MYYSFEFYRQNYIDCMLFILFEFGYSLNYYILTLKLLTPKKFNRAKDL